MIGTALRLFIALTLLTGVIYPLAITVIGQTIWHEKAAGMWLEVNNRIVGSKWIGQTFSEPRYFWGRPSSSKYDAMNSGGSNLGPTNPQLKKQIEERVAALLKADPEAKKEAIPSDLLYASGSGLDPDISLQGALFQLERVAKARDLDETGKGELRKMIELHAKQRFSRLFSQPYVNVLEINIALDELASKLGKKEKAQ